MLALTTLTLAMGFVPAALAAPARASAVPMATTTTTGTITGSGTIQVVANTTSHSINFSSGTPSQAVGCLNAVGQVVLDDCAVFTADGLHVSTSAGVCSFANASQPTNTDAVYGGGVHAFSCWAHAPVSTDVQFYTVSGIPYNFLGQGDSNMVSNKQLISLGVFFLSRARVNSLRHVCPTCELAFASLFFLCRVERIRSKVYGTDTYITYSTMTSPPFQQHLQMPLTSGTLCGAARRPLYQQATTRLSCYGSRPRKGNVGERKSETGHRDGCVVVYCGL